jgi:hypothetical protein
MNKKKNTTKLIAIVCCCFWLLTLATPAWLVGFPAQAASPLWDGTTAASFAGGTGTAADPYLISTGAQLAYLAQSVNTGTNYAGKYIKLTQDILLNAMNADGTFVSSSPKQFTSIGNGSSKSFQGNFDGDGHKVIGLYINKSWINYAGLFGYAGAGSMIRDFSISGSVAGGNYSGGVAGYTDGIITGCAVSCTLTTSWTDYQGGVAGYAGAASEINNCTFSGAVAGSDYVGGAAGYLSGKITGCSINGVTVTGDTNVGGVAGYAAGMVSEISGCTVSGSIIGTGDNVGGVAGRSDSVITGCSIYGVTVDGAKGFVGGIAGYAAGTGSEISNCSMSGTVNGNMDNVGGLAGRSEGVITGCSAYVTVTGGSSFAGGVAGYAAGTGSEISNCSVSGTVSGLGNQGVGGVAGKLDGVITGCSSACTVTGEYRNVGGVVGYAGTGSMVSNSSNSGSVTGEAWVGGVAGYTDGVITVCINTGGVTGVDKYIGGVVGYADRHNTVNNCLNAGNIDGGSGFGGIGGIAGAGNWTGDAATINNNLNIGTVTGGRNVGGIAGLPSAPLDSGDAWNNYYVNDYAHAPYGTNTGDVMNQDGAVPVGGMSWEEIKDLLNSNNPAGDDIWSLNDEGIPVPGIPGSDDAVEILHSGIKEGKFFTADAVEAGASATITSNSVFTVTFSLRYNEGCNLEAQTLGLAKNGAEVQLPAGTSVIMLAEGAYYYINLPAATGKLSLGDFIKMGSASARYAPAAQAQPNEVKDYLFIFDFTKTSSQVAAGTCHVELLDAEGGSAGIMPAVTVAGTNTYSLAASSAVGALNVNLTRITAAGYDYITDGKSYAYELYLERNGAAVPFPTGARINGNVISSPLPYAFTAAAFGDASISVDMSGCVNPLAAGSYIARIKAYACTESATPRAGYLLAGGSTTLAVAAPAQYAIRASAPVRVFDKSASAIPVAVNIQTLGAGAVKSTLQRKYGTSYVDVAAQKDLPVSISGGTATLPLPAGSDKGTYRFALTLYDSDGAAKARAAESIIIK